MAIDKMNSKIEAFVPSADPGKIQECWSKLNEVLESGSAKDLQVLNVKYGSVLGYKCFCYMVEALYHGVTPSWVDGSVIIESTTQQEVKPVVTKPWWA